jgi:prolipoprotein diacylglyceryltransferase
LAQLGFPCAMCGLVWVRIGCFFGQAHFGLSEVEGKIEF